MNKPDNKYFHDNDIMIRCISFLLAVITCYLTYEKRIINCSNASFRKQKELGSVTMETKLVPKLCDLVCWLSEGLGAPGH